MPQPDFQQSVTLTDLNLLPPFLIVLGIFVAALAVFSFTRKWYAIILGFLLIFGGIGFAGYSVLETVDSLKTGNILEDNAVKTQAWAKERYQLDLDVETSSRLSLGVENFDSTSNERATFGTVEIDNVPSRSGTPYKAPITLVYAEDDWKIVILSSNGDSFREIVS